MANSFLGMFRSTRQDDPLANVKSVEAWAARLPANDPLGVLEAAVRLLEDLGTAQSEVNASRVLALMALDRLTLPMQAEVLAQYRMPTLSEDVRRRLWHACNDLGRWFAYAYERAAGVAPGPDGEVTRRRVAVPGIFSRMFHYRGLQARLGLFQYESWIPASWKQLHRTYLAACAQGVATEPFALAKSARPEEQCSAEQEFLQILLLQRVNSGNLSATQVAWTAQWLRTWVHALLLREPSVDGDGYWLDLGQGEGLALRRPATPAGQLLYLDMKPLHEQVSALIALLGAQLAVVGAEAPESHVLEEQLKLARRLDHLWRPQAGPRARRGERRTEQRTTAVAAGWAAIVATLRGASARGPEGTRQYTFEDATRLAVHGYVDSVPRDPYGNALPRRIDRHGWQVQDTSESGILLESATAEAQKQQVGALLALQYQGDSRWGIGIVRRLRRRTAEHTELGVEIIADNSFMTMALPAAARDSGYSVNGVDAGSASQGFHVLYLPPQHHRRSHPVRSLVLPAGEFAPRRKLSIIVEGVARAIRLSVPLEQAKDWVWTSFEITDGAVPG